MINVYDIFIIGGGINGVGIARDAAGRGYSVCLSEMGKIGGATSSWSTKLIHGGLRYLENYEFRLVRESLKEREAIHKIAPSITEPIPFIIPHTNKLRPKWIIKTGLFIYDHLGGKNSLPKSSYINIEKLYPDILKSKFKVGYKYYDLQVDDQKLALMNANDASLRNALILENTKVIKSIRQPNYWDIYLDNNKVVKSKILINASGPWVNEVIKNVIKIDQKKRIRLVKGSHIITKKLYNEKIAFTLQNTDNRIIFIIPYKDKFSLIGTTEVEVNDPNSHSISKQEIDYLINSVNFYLNKKIDKSNIVETFSGIRPLIEDYKEKTSKVSRDYIFDINTEKNNAPLLTIYGGKLTTYRVLAEKILNQLQEFLPKDNRGPWTNKLKLNQLK